MTFPLSEMRELSLSPKSLVYVRKPDADAFSRTSRAVQDLLEQGTSWSWLHPFRCRGICSHVYFFHVLELVRSLLSGQSAAGIAHEAGCTHLFAHLRQSLLSRALLEMGRR